MKLKSLVFSFLLMCIFPFIFTACSTCNDEAVKYITDFNEYEDMPVYADKIDVELENKSQILYSFTIEDRIIVDEIVNTVRTTKLEYEGNGAFDLGENIYITIWTDIKSYRLNVRGVNFNKKRYTFITQDLENKIKTIVENRGFMDITFVAKSEANCSWQENKNYPNIKIIRSYDEFVLYRQVNAFISIKYEADFFKCYCLIVVELETNNSAQRYCVSKVIFKKGQIIIYINEQNTSEDGGAAVMGEYFAFIEISNTISFLDENIIVEKN